MHMCVQCVVYDMIQIFGLNEDLFLLAEKEMNRIEKSDEDIGKYKPLIKLYDRADIINDIA